jgi:hypothetical protein
MHRISLGKLLVKRSTITERKSGSPPSFFYTPIDNGSFDILILPRLFTRSENPSKNAIFRHR